VLLALPALPIPTGGVTHAFEIVAALLALELMAGRREVWLPGRLRRVELSEGFRERLSGVLLPRLRKLERRSRPRFEALFGHRLSGISFGLVVLVLTAAAFFAPPFTGLDTLPALGVVVLSFGYLARDALLMLVGTLIGAAGIVLIIGFGAALADLLRRLL
jgi:hypothetical protein